MLYNTMIFYPWPQPHLLQVVVNESKVYSKQQLYDSSLYQIYILYNKRTASRHVKMAHFKQASNVGAIY